MRQHKLVTSGIVQRALDISATRVSQLVQEGALHPQRINGGLRLFEMSEVERVARERAARGSRRAGASS